MNIKQQIQEDFKKAFKEKNFPKKTFLGVLINEINQKEYFNTPGDELSLQIIKKMEKSLLLSNDEQSKKELEWLFPYLPKMMSEEEIKTIIQDYIINDGVSSIKDIMILFNKNYKGKADNSLVSNIGRMLLN